MTAMRYPFLSPEWITAMRALRAEYATAEAEVSEIAANRRDALEIAANVTVTSPPFGDGPILGHIDTTGPTLMLEEGHLDRADFGVELPYDLARQLFVERDPAQVMPALLGGAIKMTGDSSKVLALAGLLAPPATGAAGDVDDATATLVRDIVRRVDEITEP